MPPTRGDVNTPEILLVDDEPSLLRSLEFTLRRKRYNVTVSSGGAEAFDLICRAQVSFDLLITDIQLNDISGLELIDKINEKGIDLPAMIITAYGEKSVIAEIEKRNISGYLIKPFSGEEFLIKVNTLIC